VRSKKRFYPILAILLVSILVNIASCSSTTTGGVSKITNTTAPPASSMPTTVSNTPVPINITAADAFALIQKNAGNPDFIIIDVRTPDEYAGGHISGAINIDYNATTFKDDVEKLNKDDTYLVYCRTGVRSGMAQGIMKDAGFKNVTSLTGGITEWIAQGFETVK